MSYMFAYIAKAFHGDQMVMEVFGSGKKETVVELRRRYRDEYGTPARAVKLYKRKEDEWVEIPIP